jgi:outer membrane receptor protein involved in Fe transport
MRRGSRLSDVRAPINRSHAALFAALLLCVGATAFASDDSTDLDTIVVTANKRTENINNVGLTISVLSGAELQERQINSLQDIANAVPGLTFATSHSNTPILTLRGVGFNESSLGVYPTVSVYIDETPLPFPVLANHSAYDLARVEVLKGPQGTLFGENSTGGAVNYIAAKPSQDFSAGASLSYGRFNEVETNAFLSGPLGNGFSARFAVNSVSSSDWQHSYTRVDGNGAENYIAGRLLLSWDKGGRARVTLNLNGWQDDSKPQAQQLVAVIPASPAFAKPVERNYPFSPQNATAADWSQSMSRPRAHNNFFQAALRADIDLTDTVRLTSLTSYDSYSQHQATDGDATNLTIDDLPKDDGSIHSINQELRVANSDAAALKWVLGGNYERSKTDENQINNFSDDSNSNPTNLYIDSAGDDNTQTLRNYAFFGHSQYALNEIFTIKAGARYTNSHIDDRNCGYSPGDGNVATLFNLLGSLLGKVPFAPIGPTDCYSLNKNLVPGQIYTSTLSQSNVSWLGGIDVHITSDTLLYANVSRGYKAGSYPSLSAATFTQLAPVTQESLTSYEIGVKSQPSRTVQLNAAAFYYDYKDKQVRNKIKDPVFNLLDTLINVPKSRIVGFEGDATVRPISGLTIAAAFTYLDSRVENSPGGQPTGFNFLGQPDTFAGDVLPFTPRWSAQLDGEYKLNTIGSVTPFFGGHVNWRSAQTTALGGDRLIFPASPVNRILPGLTYINTIAAYSTTDVRLGVESVDGRWNVRLWGKNIFNKYYWTNVIQTIDSESRFAGRPATYGIAFGVKVN